MTTARRPLLLLDTASLYFRAFYGVPDKVRASDGTPINAVRGLLDMIAKLATTYDAGRVVACWDDDWRPQWRVDLIPTYKTHRVETETATGPDIEEVPDPLLVQIPLIRTALSLLGIAIIGAAEAEADDVIGSLATQASEPVDVVTGDRDLFQLVDDASDVRVVYTGRGMSNLEVLDDAAVVAKYGVLPTQYADFAVLRGDPSDGLPGVAGIGEKTAATLLAAHGDLAGILRAARAGEGMSAGVAGKILAATDYLAVAPTVVEVVRTLPLTLPDPSAPDTAASATFAEQWSLGTSMSRAIDALTR